MKRFWRIGAGVAGLAALLAFAEVSSAQAQVRFEGHFRGPHGEFSIGVGSPVYPVGSYLPYGHRVFQRPRYGYGFWSRSFACRSHRVRHAHWIPVRRHQRRWIVVERPVVIAEQRRPYSDDRYYDDRNYNDRDSRDRYYADRDYDRGHDRYDRRYEDDVRYGGRYGYDSRDNGGWRHKHNRHCRH